MVVSVPKGIRYVTAWAVMVNKEEERRGVGETREGKKGVGANDGGGGGGRCRRR